MKKYDSKIGIEIVLFLGLIFGIVGFSIFSETGITFLSVLIFLIPLLLIGSILFSISYTISGSNLNVRCSILINQDIDINKIEKITETNNLLSSPAASLDRLAITFNQTDCVMVSPKNKQAFIDDLLAVNPNIEVVYKEQ